MHYDLIIIGGGPGGYVAAIRAAQLGLKTALVEKESLGGICLNWGCIPTKALIKSAQAFECIHHAADFGIKVSDSTIDFGAIIGRSRAIAQNMSRGIDFLMKKHQIAILTGFGQLKGSGMVLVTDQEGHSKTYQAKHIILATGGHAKELSNVKQDGEKVINYREAMTLTKQPKSILIIGSGAIGIEFAYFYNAIGTKVTIVEYLDRIVPAEDEDIAKELAYSFSNKGINILTRSLIQSVDTSGTTCKASIKTPDGTTSMLETDLVLSAVGITTNIKGIGLEEIGITIDKDKVLVDPFYCTNVAGIYAVGDIVPGPALAHVASAEGIICIEKIAGHHPEPLNYNNIPGCTYCSPEIASVGYTEQAAKEAGYTIKVGKFPFSASGKAHTAGKKEGFVKIIFDAKYGELLGAHMIGAHVTELIAAVVTARKLEATAQDIINTVHPHPSMSEAIMEATAAAYGVAIHL